MARKIEKKVVVKGDTSQATREMRRLGMAMRKAEADQKKLEAQNKKTENSDKRLIQTLNKQRMAYDKGFAAKKRFETTSRSLEKALQRNLITQDQYNRELAQARHHYEQAGMGANQYNKQIRTSRFHTANLTAQFNDIGVMMASGQSPFILAAQQGTQITQVLQQMGGTGREQIGALTAAFKSMINPTTILTLGIIAGAAALVQWGRGALSAGEEAEALAKKAKKARENIRQMRLELNAMQAGISPEEFSLLSAVREAAQQVAEAERDLAKNRGRGALHYQEQLNAAEKLLATAKEELNEYRQITRAKREHEESTDKLSEQERLLGEQLIERIRNEEEAVRAADKAAEARTREARFLAESLNLAIRFRGEQQVMEQSVTRTEEESQKTAVNYKALKKELGEAAFKALALSEVDITSGVDEAAKAAARLAGDLGISLAHAMAMQKMASAEEVVMSQPVVKGSMTDRYDTDTLLGMGFTEEYLKSVGKLKDKAGGRGKKDRFPDRFEQLRESLLTEEELEKESFERRQAVLKEALERELITRQQYQEMFADLQKKHQEKMTSIDVYAHGTALEKTDAFLGDMANALQSGNEQMLKIAKAFGAAQALVSAWVGASKALELPFPQNIAAFAKVLAQGLSAVQAIKSVTSGGGGGGGGASSGAAGAVAPQTPSTFVNVTLPEQGPISVGSVRDLIAQINEAVKDGARLEGIRVT